MKSGQKVKLKDRVTPDMLAEIGMGINLKNSEFIFIATSSERTHSKQMGEKGFDWLCVRNKEGLGGFYLPSAWIEIKRRGHHLTPIFKDTDWEISKTKETV